MWRLAMKRVVGAVAFGATAAACYGHLNEGKSSRGISVPENRRGSSTALWASISPPLGVGVACEESKEKEHTVEDILRAAEDVLRSTEGIVMLFTNTSDANFQAPAGRPVKAFKTPRLDDDAAEDLDAVSDPRWCERLWFATNKYSEKVDQVNLGVIPPIPQPLQTFFRSLTLVYQMVMLSPSFSSQAEQEQLVQHWRVRQVWQLLCDAGAVRPEGPEGKWRILQAGAERHLGGER